MPTNIRKPRIIALVVIPLVLIAALVIALVYLDAFLLKEARAQADAFGQRIGRPVTLKDVSTKLLSGLAVRVSGLEIGAAPGEPAPLVTLDRLEVRAALLKAMRSRGKEIEIRSAEVEGLTINIIRFQDGSTNLERLQAKLAPAAPPAKAPETTTEAPADLSNVQVDHFAFKEGRIRFIDESTGISRRGKSRDDSQHELEIRHLDVRLDGLKASKSLEVVIKAAILVDQRNFEMHVATAPLPPSLVPTPTRLVLKVQPIDLRPLAPYLPRSVGLEEGQLAADFAANLGNVVSGGEGPTSLRGTLRASELRFAGAEGGKPFDVVLDAAVQADVSKGDLQIERLRLDVGPAGISGKGRASGLFSGEPRIEGLELQGHDLDPARIAALYPPLGRQLKGQVSGPIGLWVRGSGMAAAPAVEVKLDFTPVRLAVPQQLAKAAGAPMTVTAHVHGAPAKSLKFDLSADLAGADMRPGESLDKPPGQPLDLFLAGTKSGGEKAPVKVELTEAKVHVRDAALNGSGWLETTGSGKERKVQFDLAVRSPRVDLDKLLLSSKKENEKPPLDPTPFTGIRGHVSAKIDALRKSKIDFTHVVADVKMADDEITLQTLSLTALGGTISADGTTVRLAHRKAPFKVAARVQNLDAARGLEVFTDRKVLAGTFNADLNLAGVGTESEDLTRSLNGTVQGHLLDGRLLGKDLLASISEPLAKALPRGLANATGDQGSTSLGKDLPFSIGIAKGYAKLKAPLKVNRPDAQMTLDGGVHLDGTLDLAGTVLLSPEAVSSLTQGKVKTNEPVPVHVKIGGPASKPTLTQVNLQDAVAIMLKHAATNALSRFLGGRVPGTEGQSDQNAQDKAKQGEDAAEKARKQALDEAAKKLKGLFGK